MILITIIAFILMLGVTVAIHEGGHMVVAKLCGVYVHEYSIGMGRILWEKQGKETKYRLRLLPIGGFVSMAGEDVNVTKDEDVVIPENRKFYNQPYLKKIAILVAGVSMNFLLAVLIFSILLTIEGVYYVPTPTTITGVRENSPAEAAGILPGDIVRKITKSDGSSTTVSSFYDMQLFLFYEDDTEPITYTIERDGQLMDFTMKQQYYPEEDTYLIGIYSQNLEKREVKWYNSVYYGVRYCFDILGEMILSLKMLFMPKGFSQVSGPVGIADVTNDVVNEGFLSYLNFVGLINLNVGLMNLLPLPVLDGGQVVIETLEKIIGRRMSVKVKSALLGSCWVLLIGIMLVATYNDILRIFAN